MTAPAPLCIVRAAAVSPLGHDLEATWSALCAGQSGVAPVTRFDVSGLCSEVAACIPGLASPTANASSLMEQLLDILAPQLQDWPLSQTATMLFTASTKAGVDILGTLQRKGLKDDRHLRQLLPHSLRQGLCQRLQLEMLAGENVSAACASGVMALIRGAQSILAGRCESALILAADLVSHFTMSGFSALRALSSSPCRPFDRQRDGLTVGEGAAALLLMPLNRAREQDLRPLALISGWGCAADALHITAPARDGRGLVKAMQQALCRAGKSNVGAVCAHGTGTVYNDAMEITAFEQIFSSMPPVFSSKGALGHSMAACGVLEVALCLQALRDRRLPPTLGCSSPEQQLDGCISPHCQNFQRRTMLSCNSGFGGVNAALVLEQPDDTEEACPFM